MQGIAKPLLFLAIVFLTLLGIAGFSALWHSLKPSGEILQISLESFDSKVSENNACFTLGLEAKNLKNPAIMVKVMVNSETFQTAEINALKEKEKKFCIENNVLKNGNNFIDANAVSGNESRRVFFHVEKTAKLEEKLPQVRILGFEKKNDFKGILKFIIQNPAGKNERAKIFNNGIEVKNSLYPDGENYEIIRLSEGGNNASIAFQGVRAEASLQNKTGFQSNVFLGILLIALLLVFFSFFVFSGKGFFENVSYSINLFFIIVMLAGFLLALFGILSAESVIAAMIAVLAVCFFAFGKNFKFPKIPKINASAFNIFLVLFFVMVLFFNLATTSNVSFWTSFYEKQSLRIFEDRKIPLLDEQANFGEKPSGYVSGYFFANSVLKFLTGSLGESVYAILLMLADFALLLTAFLFFKKVGLGSGKAKLAVMLMSVGGFLLSDLLFTPRHIIALSLGFLALSLLAEKKILKAGIIAGIAMFVQPPVIILLVPLALALTREKIKDIIKFTACAGFFAVLIFSPVLAAHGIPTQASADTWGYLFGMPFYGVLVDLLAQLVFFFLILLPLSRFRIRIDGFLKRTLAVLLVLLAVQLFLSYRVNVATIIIFSFVGVYLFPEKLLKNARIRKAVFAVFTVGTLFAVSVVYLFCIPETGISAADYLSRKTPDSERFLVEPALGHYIVFFTEKKIMSDLAVEYENDKYLQESFEFLETGDLQILKKHNINYVFNRSFIVETQPVGSKAGKIPIEFKQLDKIFDNGSFYIHKTANG